jgi:hypothetical protein
MNCKKFEWTPDFWQGWRESDNPYRPSGLLMCSINHALSPCSLPVRLWNRRKKGFVQKFRFPAAFHKLLRDAGARTDRMAGDGIIATVPLSLGRFRFPPSAFSPLSTGWIDGPPTGLHGWLMKCGSAA